MATGLSFYSKQLHHNVDQRAKQNNREQGAYEGTKNYADKAASDNADDCPEERQTNATSLEALNETRDTSNESANDPSYVTKDVLSAGETTQARRRRSAWLFVYRPPPLLDSFDDLAMPSLVLLTLPALPAVKAADISTVNTLHGILTVLV
ncbi:MAG TPA: hypothetical protein VN493_12245 [Thermoanaerobaculia bacterium]|nr:hypothetical protein [Thermoanaerobaculia bacterium]